MTPGWKTSEFWMTLAAQAVSTAAASGAFTGDKATQVIGLAGSILTALGYQIARTGVKKASASMAKTFNAQPISEASRR